MFQANFNGINTENPKKRPRGRFTIQEIEDEPNAWEIVVPSSKRPKPAKTFADVISSLNKQQFSSITQGILAGTMANSQGNCYIAELGCHDLAPVGKQANKNIQTVHEELCALGFKVDYVNVLRVQSDIGFSNGKNQTWIQCIKVSW